MPLGEKGSRSELVAFSAKSKMLPVASGTQFPFAGLIKGLITLEWFRSRLGDGALFAGFGAGWGGDSGSGRAAAGWARDKTGEGQTECSPLIM
jgi:hypothetical protein